MVPPPAFVPMLWIDDAGVDPADLPSSRRRNVAFREARRIRKWRGLCFGGVAFKYQAEVPDELLGLAATVAALGGVDVITTSGRATGDPPSLRKIEILSRSLGEDLPLAIASGITPENAEAFLPYVRAFLVATGIEKRFGRFDPGRVRALAAIVHA